MGKIYCTECGAEMKDSVKFCSNCGSNISDTNSNNDKVTSNAGSTNDIIKRIELPIFIGGLISIFFFFFIMGIWNPFFVAFGGFIGSIGIIICSFLMGYLSDETIIFVLAYAIIICGLLYFIFSHDWHYYDELMPACVCIIVFSVIGKFIKIKFKS